jgi:hypothetical protein
VARRRSAMPAHWGNPNGPCGATESHGPTAALCRRAVETGAWPDFRYRGWSADTVARNCCSLPITSRRMPGGLRWQLRATLTELLPSANCGTPRLASSHTPARREMYEKCLWLREVLRGSENNLGHLHLRALREGLLPRERENPPGQGELHVGRSSVSELHEQLRLPLVRVGLCRAPAAPRGSKPRSCGLQGHRPFSLLPAPSHSLTHPAHAPWAHQGAVQRRST